MAIVSQEAVFRAWLERKNKEYREARAVEKREMERERKAYEERMAKGQAAYKSWLRSAELADEEIHRESVRKRQKDLLDKEDRQRRAIESARGYREWKKRKETEAKITRSSNETPTKELSPRSETPTLPGYLSVWSCDDHMTDTITSRIKRPLTYSLTEPQRYVEICDRNKSNLTF